PASPWTYTLSLHDALPILQPEADGQPEGSRGEHDAHDAGKGEQQPADAREGERCRDGDRAPQPARDAAQRDHGDRPELVARALRSEEHTSELQSRSDLVCR